jgi:chemotaxis protein CheZ
MAQHIGFKLGVEEYSVPILSVREIIRVPEMTRMPQAPEYIQGVANLRGKVVPIVSTRLVVNRNGQGNGTAEAERVIVLINGKAAYGILVDGITGVIAIDEGAIEPPERIMNGASERFVGVAKCNGRLVVVLDPKKLLPQEGVQALDESDFDVGEVAVDGTVEVVRTVQTMGGDVTVRELRDARDFLSRKVDANDPNREVIENLIAFMEAVSVQDCKAANAALEQLGHSPENSLFKEVGKVTRRLHDSLRSFKEAIDPKISSIVATEVPSAVDRLQYCIQKTEEAANKTMAIVEKHLLQMDELSANIRKLQGPDDAVKYLKEFKNRFEDDLTEIITTQSFQDITGQTLNKVIDLVGEIEKELVGMVAAFGLKIDIGARSSAVVNEKVSQAGVDDLLKEFGF